MQQQFFKAVKQDGSLRDSAVYKILDGSFLATRGDKLVLCLDWVRWNGTAWVADPIAETSTRAAAIKAASDSFDPTFLAFSDNAAFNREGDRSDLDVANGKESILLDLGGAEMLDLFNPNGQEISENYLDLVIEVEETDANGNKSTLLHATIRVQKDIIQGTEDTAIAATPTKPTLEECQTLFVPKAANGARFRFSATGLEFYFDGDGKWRELIPVLVDGNPVPAWGEPKD